MWTLGTSMKFYRENTNSIKIGQPYRPLYVGTKVRITAVGAVMSLLKRCLRVRWYLAGRKIDEVIMQHSVTLYVHGAPYFVLAAASWSNSTLTEDVTLSKVCMNWDGSGTKRPCSDHGNIGQGSR
jgi:hypothetical protein